MCFGSNQHAGSTPATSTDKRVVFPSHSTTDKMSEKSEIKYDEKTLIFFASHLNEAIGKSSRHLFETEGHMHEHILNGDLASDASDPEQKVSMHKGTIRDMRDLIDLKSIIESGHLKEAIGHFHAMDTAVRDLVPPLLHRFLMLHE